jgi:DNA processing protein
VDPTERAAWLRLVLTPDLGPRAARELLAALGLPHAIFAAGRNVLRQVVPDALAGTLSGAPAADIETAVGATEIWLGASPRNFLLTFADADYPRALLDTTDPPPLLFGCGRRELLAQPQIAIVGSRSSTRQGAATAESFAHALACAGLTIVSGLATGIDAAAHRGALRAAAGGAAASTIAVIGTGIDVVYPPANRALTGSIRSEGLVLSEFALGAPPLPHHFPRRNRVLAGLSRGVLVVEAALRSGSLITARLAAEMGREVFAIPGSIHSPMSRGCHRLIKDGAKLVESAQDVLQELRWPVVAAPAAAHSAEPAAALPPARQAVLAALGHDPVDLDTLAARCGRDTGSLSADLLELELAQHVERLPGNRYQRLR